PATERSSSATTAMGACRPSTEPEKHCARSRFRAGGGRSSQNLISLWIRAELFGSPCPWLEKFAGTARRASSYRHSEAALPDPPSSPSRWESLSPPPVTLSSSPISREGSLEFLFLRGE